MKTATNIHPSSVIEKGAELGANVHIGPFCHIGAQAKIGDGVRTHSHVVVMNRTIIGASSEIFPGAVLGAPAQDTKYKDEPTTLEIGTHCTIREHVTMHIASVGGDGVTRIGDHCMFMAGSHVAHDCRIGDHITLINHAVLGGHVQIGDSAMIGGNSAVHQHVRVGAGAMVGGMTGVEGDVIPYGMVMGDRAALQGLNWVGLERRGFSPAQLKEMRRFYKELFEGAGSLAERLVAAQKTWGSSDLVKPILDFVASPHRRSLCLPE